MFYDNFLRFCNLNGVAPTRVAVETGGHKSDATRWKNGSIPTDARKLVIAEYFGITVEELMADSTKNEILPDGIQEDEEWLKIKFLMDKIPEEKRDAAFELIVKQLEMMGL